MNLQSFNRFGFSHIHSAVPGMTCKRNFGRDFCIATGWEDSLFQPLPCRLSCELDDVSLDMGVLQQLKKLQGLPQIAYLGNLLRLQDRLPKAQMECLTLFRNFISLLWSNSLACMWADILSSVLDIAWEQGQVGHRLH